MSNVEILDCTLRDGGYVNDWNFGEINIKKTITELTNAELDIIECGFLSNKKKYDKEKTIFDTIEQIKEFIPVNKKNSKYVCMINYGDYDVNNIPQYDGSSVDGIRVVFHKNEVEGAMEFCRRLSQKGYMLFIQPMVTINYSDIELLHLIEVVNEIRPYAFYIVDSFGVMKKNDLLRMFYLIDNNLLQEIKVGYHSHNNLQLAYSNAQALIEINSNRTKIIDSSVFGMGRGAGNLNTELFVQYVSDSIGGSYKVYPLLKIIDEVLSKIYSINYWGYSLPHYLSANCNCHPNYASYLSEKNTLTVKSINEILSLIKEEKKAHFDKSYIEELYLNYQENYVDDEEAIVKLREVFKNMNVVVIAPGTSIERYDKKIQQYINHKDTISISVNFIPEMLESNYVFVSNKKRFEGLLESKLLNNISTKVILTSNINDISRDYINVNYHDLLNDTNAVRDNSTLMLLKLLARLDVAKIALAGFDGYSYVNAENYVDKNMILTNNNQTVKQLNMGIGDALRDICKYMDVEFITPTKYFSEALMK